MTSVTWMPIRWSTTWALLQYIRAVAQPRVIILSQRLWFQEYEELHDQTALVNHRLQILVEESHPVLGIPPTELQFMRHQYGIWRPNRWSLFAEDKVHLIIGVFGSMLSVSGMP